MRAFHPVSLFEYPLDEWNGPNGAWDCFVLSLVISSISAADITYAYGLIKSSSLISFTLYVARPDAVVVAHFSLDTFVCRLFWIAPIRSNWISHWAAKVHSHQPLFSAKKNYILNICFFFFCCKFDTEHIVKCIFHWICDGFLHYSQTIDLQRNLTAKLLLFVFGYFVLTWITLRCRLNLVNAIVLPSRVFFG